MIASLLPALAIILIGLAVAAALIVFVADVVRGLAAREGGLS